MRVNDFVQSNIPNLSDYSFESWLDIGTGEGLVAMGWSDFSKIGPVTTFVPKMIAIDKSATPELWNPEDSFKHLDDKWETHKESYDESSKLWNEKFDLITIMDTIQYYYRPDGERVLDNLINKTNKLLIIWTTDGYYPDNGHVSCWHKEDFENRGMKTVIAKNFHAGPPIVGNGLLAWYENK